MATGTPATSLLTKAGVKFSEHEYQHDPGVTSFGLEAAEKLGFDPAQVFKTLIASVSNLFSFKVPAT